MSSFAAQEDTQFDLRKFWEHSVGCAILADKVCTDESSSLKEKFEFDEYWIGAILHDIGKLILGQFFWDHFESVLNKMFEEEGGPIAFREAERQGLEEVNHAHVGELMLLKSNMKEELVDVVRGHHGITEASGKLTCLVSLVDSMSKELGLGYVEDEPPEHADDALKVLGIDKEEADKLRESLGEAVTAEIKDMVGKCLS